MREQLVRRGTGIAQDPKGRGGCCNTDGRKLLDTCEPLMFIVIPPFSRWVLIFSRLSLPGAKRRRMEGPFGRYEIRRLANMNY